MKKSVLLLAGFYLCCMVFIAACTQKEKKEINIAVTETIIEGEENSTFVSLGVEGMTCQMGCANHIKNKLAKMEGVINAEVLFDENMARIQYDESILTEKDLINAIEKMQDGQYSVITVEIERTVKKGETISSVDKIKQNGSSAKEKISNNNATEKISYQPQIKPVVFPNIFSLLRLFMPEK